MSSVVGQNLPFEFRDCPTALLSVERLNAIEPGEVQVSQSPWVFEFTIRAAGFSAPVRLVPGGHNDSPQHTAHFAGLIFSDTNTTAAYAAMQQKMRSFSRSNALEALWSVVEQAEGGNCSFRIEAPVAYPPQWEIDASDTLVSLDIRAQESTDGSAGISYTVSASTPLPNMTAWASVDGEEATRAAIAILGREHHDTLDAAARGTWNDKLGYLVAQNALSKDAGDFIRYLVRAHRNGDPTTPTGMRECALRLLDVPDVWETVRQVLRSKFLDMDSFFTYEPDEMPSRLTRKFLLGCTDAEFFQSFRSRVTWRSGARDITDESKHERVLPELTRAMEELASDTASAPAVSRFAEYLLANPLVNFLNLFSPSDGDFKSCLVGMVLQNPAFAALLREEADCCIRDAFDSPLSPADAVKLAERVGPHVERISEYSGCTTKVKSEVAIFLLGLRTSPVATHLLPLKLWICAERPEEMFNAAEHFTVHGGVAESTRSRRLFLTAAAYLEVLSNDNEALGLSFAVSDLLREADAPTGTPSRSDVLRFLRNVFELQRVPLDKTRNIFREIYGQRPWQQKTIDSAWRAEPVLGLAGDIYDRRAFQELPRLADLLEDEGCADSELLGWCRSGGPHVHGAMWLDLILGKA